LGKECIEIELDESLFDKINGLVEKGDFKSVDDFIELASHEYLLRHSEKGSVKSSVNG
jgi:Arc/MetJ-type ribon-helix-helix transcriptional regulator